MKQYEKLRIKSFIRMAALIGVLFFIITLLPKAKVLFSLKRVDAQTIERWLYIPYGNPARIDHEPQEKAPNGRTEFRFTYEGRPNSIHRFSRSVAHDYRMASESLGESSNGIPDITEVNRLLELFQRAAIEAEQASLSASMTQTIEENLASSSLQQYSSYISSNTFATSSVASVSSMPISIIENAVSTGVVENLEPSGIAIPIASQQ